MVCMAASRARSRIHYLQSMSLNVVVGTLAWPDPLPQDAEHNLWQCQRFDVIDQVLRAHGLRGHREPTRLPGKSQPFVQSIKSEIMEFLNHAEYVEGATELRFPHLLGMNFNDAVFVPLDFAKPIELPVSDDDLHVIGSSLRLFDECRTLARTLGILEDLEYVPIPSIVAQILDAIGSGAQSLRPDITARVSPAAEGGWPEGGGGCQKLYSAASVSVMHGAAVVIH